MKKFLSVCALCSLTLLSCVNMIAAKDVTMIDVTAATNDKQVTWYPTTTIKGYDILKIDNANIPKFLYKGRNDKTQEFLTNDEQPFINVVISRKNADRKSSKQYAGITLQSVANGRQVIAIGDIYQDKPNPTVYWYPRETNVAGGWYLDSENLSDLPSLENFSRSFGLDLTDKQKSFAD